MMDDESWYNDSCGPYDPTEDCDHVDYDADILTGQAQCWRCGYRWFQSSEEIQREIEHQRDYDAYIHREMSKETWWGRILFGWPDWLRSAWHSLTYRRPRQEIPADDDIPF